MRLFLIAGVFALLIAVLGTAIWLKHRSKLLSNEARIVSGQEINFTERSSLPDKQKIGVWNADIIELVKSLEDAPRDGSSYIDFSQFDSTAKKLDMSEKDKKKIEDLTIEAVEDLFIAKNGPHTDFFTQHFFVKNIKIYFKPGSRVYKDTYSFSDGQLEMIISYKFTYDWFTDDDGLMRIINQNLQTDGPIVTILWFDYLRGDYLKLAQPLSVPSYDFPRLNNDYYPLFKKGFGAIISEEEALKIADETLTNRDPDFIIDLQVLDDTLFPSYI
jgi:hypothetical protein